MRERAAGLDPPVRPRVLELDGLRGLAIALVLIWHYLANLLPAGSLSQRSSDRWLWFCWIGVDLFFVLSGFLIAGILMDNDKSRRYYSTFFRRRFCRILPVYYLTLGLYAIGSSRLRLPAPAATWLWGNHPSLGPYLLFLQNWTMAFEGGFGPTAISATWSLAVEEQFYVLLPLAVRFLSRRTLGVVTAASILVAPWVRVFLDQHVNRIADFVLLPGRMDSLAWGVLVALCVRNERTRLALVRHTLARRVLLAGLWAGVLCMDGDSVPGQYVHSLLALGYALLLAEVVGSGGAGPLVALLRVRVLRWLGLCSFSLYLFHQPVLGVAHGLAFGRAPALASPATGALTLLALLTTCGLAALSYRFVEVPFMRLGHSRPFD
ncbi:MAG: acyltransferase [Vicinamibacteria bacterium]